MIKQDINLARSLFYEKKYKEALGIFKKLNDNYGTGLCYLLLKSPKKAAYYWNKNKENCPACCFGLSVIDLINFKPTRIPKFFQTRAFLEIYINLFLENNLMDYCENLIANCDNLYKSNPESYKFIARALYANGYFDLAVTFCKKTLDLFYADPEAILIISQCYYLLGKTDMAKIYLEKIKSFAKDYYPAILFEEILSKEIQYVKE